MGSVASGKLDSLFAKSFPAGHFFRDAVSQLRVHAIANSLDKALPEAVGTIIVTLMNKP